jgi:hypothetical protein
VAEKLGVSLNSIVKDAVDKWLEHHSEVPKKHDLILYADDESLTQFLKSMDNIAKEGGWFRTYCGPSSHSAIKILQKLKWFNGTIEPYSTNRKHIERYCSEVMKKILKEAKQNQICCFDFMLEDIAKTMPRQALKLEDVYNGNRIPGLMFCPYKIKIAIGPEIDNMLELFKRHEQIYILSGRQVYKMHITQENIHKLFVS